jgi:hypothetical protein
MKAWSMLIVVLGISAGTMAGPLDEALKRQRNGLWEMSSGGKTRSFCVTETVKLEAQKQMAEAMRQLGCRTTRESFSGSEYEIHLDCSHPTLGPFQMSLKARLEAERLTARSTIAGQSPLVRSIAASPDLEEQEWRWVRACRPDEKPGLQR